MSAKKKPSAWSLATKKVQEKPLEDQNGKTVIPQNGNTANDEKFTEKITLYVSWKHLDRLNEMTVEYQKRKIPRKRMDTNKLLRLMIEKTTVDDLLTE